MEHNEKNRWLTPPDFEVEFKMPTGTQAKKRMKHKKLADGTKKKQVPIPHAKVGKFIFYDRHKIDKWLEDHEVVGI